MAQNPGSVGQIKTSDAALSVRGLAVALPPGMERPYAVEEVSFDLPRGQILCIIGESGSGKSVTASAVMGLLAPPMRITAGEIVCEGTEVVGAGPDVLRKMRGRVVSMIFQDPLSALNPLMTVGDQIMEVMTAHQEGTKESRRARALELLREVGLPDPPLMFHQYPFRLSGGQRQRVMIVMFITHDFGVVAELADSVIVMEKGHIVEQGSAEEVLHKPRHPYTKRLIAAVPTLNRSDRLVPDRDASETVLKVEELNKTYRSGGGLFGKARVVPAVQGASFELRRGHTLGIVGESGSGKSTLGRLLIKLMDSDGGSILFRGQDIAPLSDAAFRSLRPRIQMIFQDPFASLNPRSTIGRILTVGPVAHGMSYRQARDKALDLLVRVGLDPEAFGRYPHEFSGGQRQRVGIARALMFDPELLIADEAVSALDVSIQAQILALLDQIQRETNVSMIFITHDLRVASQICDEIAVMQRGRIVEMGPPSQIFCRPRSQYTRDLVAAIPGESREILADEQLKLA